MSGAERHDVLVVGAGPAGLAATAALAAGGLTVRLIDEQPTAGGQVWRGVEHRLRGGGESRRREDRAARAALDALAHPAVDYARGATLLEARVIVGSDLGAARNASMERTGDDGTSADGAVEIGRASCRERV